MKSGVADVATPVRSLPAHDQVPEGFAAPGEDTIPADLPEPVVEDTIRADLPEPVVETKVVEPSGVDSPMGPSEVSVDTPMVVSERPSDPPKEVVEGAGDNGLSSPSSVPCSITIIFLVISLY